MTHSTAGLSAIAESGRRTECQSAPGGVSIAGCTKCANAKSVSGNGWSGSETVIFEWIETVEK